MLYYFRLKISWWILMLKMSRDLGKGSTMKSLAFEFGFSFRNHNEGQKESVGSCSLWFLLGTSFWCSFLCQSSRLSLSLGSMSTGSGNTCRRTVEQKVDASVTEFQNSLATLLFCIIHCILLLIRAEISGDYDFSIWLPMSKRLLISFQNIFLIWKFVYSRLQILSNLGAFILAVF